MSARPLARLRPGVRVGIVLGLELVHDARWLGCIAKATLPLSASQTTLPFCALVDLLELGEPPVVLEADLELREIEVVGIAEAAEEQPVHDLGQRLVAAADAAVGGDVEDDRVGRDVLGDLAEQDVDA